jgi:hypothetical protein
VGRRPTSSSHGRLFGLLRGGGGISPEEDFPAAPTSGIVTDALERATLCPEASPPPPRSVRLPLSLLGLDTEAEAPRSTINSLGPRGQTPPGKSPLWGHLSAEALRLLRRRRKNVGVLVVRVQLRRGLFLGKSVHACCRWRFSRASLVCMLLSCFLFTVSFFRFCSSAKRRFRSRCSRSSRTRGSECLTVLSSP